VLDTRGINVWCAAGKGTFGTEEVVHRIEATGLSEMVNHRTLILPQLGAPGVAAHEVRRRSGFRVEYGPVRAADLPRYLQTREATPEMRRVRFTLLDRIVLIPVELVHVFLPTAAAAILLWLLAGPLIAWGRPADRVGDRRRRVGRRGALSHPAPLAAHARVQQQGIRPGRAGPAFIRPRRARGWALAHLLGLPPVTAYLALNFTGSTPFTSKTGVQREMNAYIPAMAWTFGIGLVLTIGSTVYRYVVSY